MLNPNVKFLVQSISMYAGDQERQTKQLLQLFESHCGELWCGLRLSQWCWDQILIPIWKESDSSLIFQDDSDSGHTANVVKANMDRKKKSVVDCPRAQTSTLLKKCEMMLTEWNKRQPTTKEELWKSPSEASEAWRIIPECYKKKWQESLPKSVQAMLKNKAGHSKPWLQSSLEVYKLSFCVVYRFLSYLHVSVSSCRNLPVTIAYYSGLFLSNNFVIILSQKIIMIIMKTLFGLS